MAYRWRSAVTALLAVTILLATLALPEAAWASGAGWQAEYFDNAYLSGSPRVVRQDGQIDFNWGSGAPAAGIPTDYFSVRWTRSSHFQAGRYRFSTETDDGVRLFVDGLLLIDQWRPMAPTRFSAEVDLTAGWHSLRMEYYEAAGGAMARLSWWEKSADTGNTWRGEYYGNRWLSGAPAFARYDANIDFDWGSGRPDARLQPDDFSVRWTRNVQLQGGRYLFATETDDGVRLYVDGRLVIDQWREMAPTRFSAEVDLTSGWHSVRMEYYEAHGGAVARLSWTRATVPDTPITEWRGEYYNNGQLSGMPQLVRNDEAIDFDWAMGRPDWRLAADGFSVRWTRDLRLAAGLYRFTTETDDGVRLYVDDRRIIDQWHVMSRTRHSHEIYLAAGVHTIRMEYFERSGQASARLDWEGPLPLPTKGNLITQVPPYPSYSWIKVYQLSDENTWRDINPRGWAALSPDGSLKIDGLPVDYLRYGDRGHPYRIEQWVDGRLARSVGDVTRGQAEFRIRANTDNTTPW
jgi:hypothetical protein